MRATHKHPRAIRWFHWINFPLIALMIWSGVLIYWANDVYLEIPDPLAHALHLNNHLAEGMGWHFLLMWAFALNGALYVAYLALSGEWRELAPREGSLREAWHVVLHEHGQRREAPPAAKFNAAQRLAYCAAIGLGGLALVSGLAVYKPVQLHGLAALMGGYEGARLVHFLVMLALVGFFVVHVAQVARAGWNNLRAMITGYEIDEEA
jgi:thiosulfate reductase cytochrome b subunit